MNLGTSNNPQSEGYIEITIQTIKDMLRACKLESEGKWNDRLPLIEFAYKNSYHSSIIIALYKALY